MKYKINDRVENEKFGKGTIIGISSENQPYLVQFDNTNVDLHGGGCIDYVEGKRCGKEGLYYGSI